MKSRFTRNKFLIIGTVLILIVTWYVSTYRLQFMLLQGDSMEPNLHSGQLLLLDKYTKKYDYQDIVAIKKDSINGLLVKRIVAVPGDMVHILDGVLYVNGESVGEDYISIDFAGIAKEPIRLGEEEFFVLGDNLKESKDSRYSEIGLICQEEIKGIVIR